MDHDLHRQKRPYSCAFDTTTVANAGYDVRAVALDGAGNTAESNAIAPRFVDNTLPSVSLVEPGPYLRGTVAIVAIATAPKGVKSVSIKYTATGANTWTEICSSTTAPYQCAWDTTKDVDGAYDLRSVMIDNGSVTTTSLDLSGRRVDNAPTSGVDVQSANIGVIGRMESGDAISFTFSESMNLSSILAGWTGTSTSVALRVRDKNAVGSGATSDVLDVFTNTTYKIAVQLGSVVLMGDYVKSNKTLGFNGTMVAASETVGGVTRTKVTVTLGSLTGGSGQRTSTTLSNMVWTPSTSAIDLTGRATSSRPITQSGAAKKNF